MFEIKPGSMGMVERQARYELMEVMSAWVWLKDTNKLDMNFLFNPPPANMKSIYLIFKKGDILWQKSDMNFCLIPTLCQK